MRRRMDHDLTPYGIVIAILCLVAIAATAHAAGAEDTFDAINMASIDTGVPMQRLTRIVSCETGGTFNPRIEGDGGHSHGAVQLNDYGALHNFYAAGYTDPYNPYQAVYFLAESLRGDHPPLGPWTWSCR